MTSRPIPQQMPRLIDERYQLIDEIGGGGMASVYRARDIKKDRIVALKMMRPELENDPEFVRLFEHEARLMKKLSHPNIVAVYGVGFEPGAHYIAMELVEGETLKELIQRQGRLDAREALEIGLLIARALQHAHQRGVVHCDIKPQNILISEKGGVRVADFGLARAGAMLFITDEAKRLGSVHYLSPEQAQGKAMNETSDIYSLGVVMYEMLCGRVPFEGDTPQKVADQVLHAQPEFPDYVHIPRAIGMIVMKMLQKDPQCRYRSAAALLGDLARARKSPEGDFVRIEAPDKKKKPVISAGPMEHAPGETFLLVVRRVLPVVAAVMLLCVGFFLGRAWLSQPNQTPRPKVMLPNFIGTSLSVAQQLADDRSLVLQVHYEVTNDAPEGIVLRQEPAYAPDTPIAEASRVEVWVSQGPVPIPVPQVLGLPISVAKQRILEAGFQVGVITFAAPEEGQQVGVVMKQTPAGGEEGYAEDVIDLWVSSN
nr:protein kinase [bacterium]